MKYCVIKNTTTVIDGSDNDMATMLINAENAGYTEHGVDILTENEYAARKMLEPETVKEPSTTEMLMLAIAELDAQREADKLETQLAIAELASTLMGGNV